MRYISATRKEVERAGRRAEMGRIRNGGMFGYMRLSKRNWYSAGGFVEPRCVRVTRGGGGVWAYFYRMD